MLPVGFPGRGRLGLRGSTVRGKQGCPPPPAPELCQPPARAPLLRPLSSLSTTAAPDLPCIPRTPQMLTPQSVDQLSRAQRHPGWGVGGSGPRLPTLSPPSALPLHGEGEIFGLLYSEACPLLAQDVWEGVTPPCLPCGQDSGCLGLDETALDSITFTSKTALWSRGSGGSQALGYPGTRLSSPIPVPEAAVSTWLPSTSCLVSPAADL